MSHDRAALDAFQRSLTLCREGRIADALTALDEAIRLRPDFAEAHSNRGAILRDLGRLTEAEIACRQALSLQPNYSDAANNLGVCLQMLGRVGEAAAAFHHAFAVRNDNIQAAYNLAHLLAGVGRGAEAAKLLEHALTVRPDFAEAALELGNMHLDIGQHEHAEEMYRRAVQARPDYAEAWYNLGNAVRLQDRIDDAIAAYSRALMARPNFPAAENNLGNLLKDQGRFDEAYAAYQRALKLQPIYPDAESNLGLMLLDNHRLEEAESAFRRALAARPEEPEYLNSLGCVLQAFGRIDEADALFRGALERDHTFIKAHTNQLTLAHYRPGITLAELADMHRNWNARHAAGLAAFSMTTRRDPQRPLRVGFVSPDFGRHPIGYFCIRVLESFDRAEIVPFCYSDRPRHDDMTTRFRAASHTWREVRRLTDEQLAEQIRADEIDVLFDLAGHTGSNRLRMFARRAAPVQISWAGYVGTTGLEAMDYLLADRFEVPVTAERHIRERVLRMPASYVTFDPPTDAPDIAPLPARARGHVTFGCFNNLAKVNGDVIRVWSGLLKQVPNARLFLKFRGLEGENGWRFRRLFEEQGIAGERLQLEGVAPHHELLAAYNQVDVALDPFPFSGGLTTLEALWMGVPVVTCPGETFASRHALSHLSVVGLDAFIVRDTDEYQTVAAQWATRLDELASLREGMRERILRSPLCDGKSFARYLTCMLKTLVR